MRWDASGALSRIAGAIARRTAAAALAVRQPSAFIARTVPNIGRASAARGVMSAPPSMPQRDAAS
ncbi:MULTISPECIES: hypothetical protein [Eggerthellaceae]|uniref:hypothetical protein n=1 Tax=Eggerthellaceae TaxID=1643826 RepID=UPI001EE4AD35|nr:MULTISPECIES: hypothetical protein [Eggerthellaceae]MDB1802844.1 hypothetical protein [Eggerthella lenta]